MGTDHHGHPALPTSGTDDELVDAWVEIARNEARKHMKSVSASISRNATSIQLVLAAQDGERVLVLDLRGGRTPEQAVRRAAARDPDATVSLRLSMDTARGLASGRMGPAKAFALRQVTIEKGDVALLTRIARDFAAVMEPVGGVKPSVSVAVVGSGVEEEEEGGGRHGVYTIQVTEGAASWIVRRRWRQLRATHQALVASHGHGASGGVAIPALPRSGFPLFGGSTSAALLRRRPALIEQWLSRVLRAVPCSPESGVGPPALLALLGADTSIGGCSVPAEALRRDLVQCGDGEAPQGEGFMALRLHSRLEVQAAAVETLVVSVTQMRALAGGCVVALAVALSQVSAIPSDASAPLAPPGDAAASAEEHEGAGSALIASSAQLLQSSLTIQCALAAVLLLAGTWLVCPRPPRALAARAGLLLRYLRVCILFARVVVSYNVTKYLARWFFPSSKQALWDNFNEWLGEMLYRHLMRLGGYWLKVGQYLASRSDFVPDPIVNHLSRMLDRNPARPLSQTLDTLMEVWGASATTIIHSLISDPISVGTIAQVHIGWLWCDGADKRPLKVAVKVQHQDIAPILRQDLRQSFVLAIVLRWLEPTMDFMPLLNELNAEHLKELDFRQEAQNLVDVRSNLARSRVPVVVPGVISSLTSEKVLVMEFCQGDSVKDAVGLTRKGIDLEQLVLRVCELWAHQMFYDGVFNGDAHAGNILVQSHPTFGPTPVLLDFGLCKRLSSIEQLGMCQLVHALEEFDGDLIMQSLQNLGFVFQSDEVEPTEVFRDLMFFFRSSEGDGEKSRAKTREKVNEDMRRGEIYSKDAKQHVKQGKKAPLEALPGVIVFVFRTIEMLQGLCTRLGVSVPFMRPMALHARQFLLANAGGAEAAAPRPRQLAALPPQQSCLPRQPAASLQDRVLALLHALADTGEVLGAQCCVVAGGRVVVDAAAGRMGPVDPRPVLPEHMFQLFEAGCPLLACLVLQLAERGLLALDRPVADAWPGFAGGGKRHVTAAALLSHATGLRAAMPRRAELKDLLDLRSMERFVAGAAVPPATGGGGAEAEFEGAPWGWAVAGLLRATSCHRGCCNDDVATILADKVCNPLGIADELKLRVSAEDESRVVRHSVAELLSELGVDLSDFSMLTNPGGAGSDPQKVTGEASLVDHSSGDPFAASGLDFERFLGPQQLTLPSTFNLSSVRRKGVPGSAMLGSARALARFYAALGSGDGRLGIGGVCRNLESRAVHGLLNDEAVRWGLGMQVGAIARRGGGRKTLVLGHRGTGGTVGFTVPAADLSVAFTCSRLSAKGSVTRRVLGTVLDACGNGWDLPDGIL